MVSKFIRQCDKLSSLLCLTVYLYVSTSNVRTKTVSAHAFYKGVGHLGQDSFNKRLVTSLFLLFLLQCYETFKILVLKFDFRLYLSKFNGHSLKQKKTKVNVLQLNDS